jgi:D-glycero-D-manno-heptose 1,7-bisphosphate phosphatase
MKTIFLDRDGVINDSRRFRYVTSWKNFIFLPGAREALMLFQKYGFRKVIITNQQGIAKGEMSVSDLDAIHSFMKGELAKDGVKIDAIYFCPHSEKERCECRKPKPGMITRAVKQLNLDINDCYLIGDSKIDIQAGLNAGCKKNILISRKLSFISLFLDRGVPKREEFIPASSKQDGYWRRSLILSSAKKSLLFVARDLLEAAEFIISREV